VNPIRTLIVDDDFRVAGIHAAYVERIPGFTVVATVHTAAAAQVATATGVSRATAQRYSSALADAGKVELIPRYDVPGRPEHRYR
jgi:response regulator of citrate/malate metabolism